MPAIIGPFLHINNNNWLTVKKYYNFDIKIDKLRYPSQIGKSGNYFLFAHVEMMDFHKLINTNHNLSYQSVNEFLEWMDGLY